MKVLSSFLIFITTIFCIHRVTAQTRLAGVQVEQLTRELIFNEAPFRQCHASSLVELADGRIMAVWFGGTYERHPDVCIWGSVRNQKGWSKPVMLADGVINDSLRYPCWNPVLFRSKNGKSFLFYKVGPSPTTWWGMFKKSNDNGLTWSEPQKLPEGILGPIKNKPIILPDGRIVSPSSVETENSWHVHFEISDDDGNTWLKVQPDTTTGFKLIQPTLLNLKDETLLALIRSDQNCIVESRSADNGLTWSKPMKTSLLNPNSGIDAVTLSNGLHILVYNPAIAGKEWFEGRSRLYIMVSADAEHWDEIFHLEENNSGEYSYPAIIQSHDGLVHISYTSNRTGIRYVVLKIYP